MKRYSYHANLLSIRKDIAGFERPRPVSWLCTVTLPYGWLDYSASLCRGQISDVEGTQEFAPHGQACDAEWNCAIPLTGVYVVSGLVWLLYLSQSSCTATFFNRLNAKM